MTAEANGNGPHPFEQTVADSLATFYHLEQMALQQATLQTGRHASPYWSAIADETRRVLSTLSFALAIHGLQRLDPAKGGDAA